MTDYCWMCNREHYKPHPTIENVMTLDSKYQKGTPMVCDKHKKERPKWECPNCRFITGTKPYPYANNDNQMCPKCETIMDVV